MCERNFQYSQNTNAYVLFRLLIAGSAYSLEYFTLTSPTYIHHDDESSDAINVPGRFPFGSQNFSSLFVRLYLVAAERVI